MVATLPPGKSGIGDDGYIAWTTDLVKSVKEDPSLTNIYPELGTVFAFSVIHAPGDLRSPAWASCSTAFGAERILWGTDCIWWGSPQWLIESFRRFQIPENLRDQFGYAEITDAQRDIIFGKNAAGLYDIDIDAVRKAIPGDKFDADENRLPRSRCGTEQHDLRLGTGIGIN